MKFLRSAATAILALSSTALAAKSDSLFDKYHAKQLSSSPISLTDATFKELAAPPRNHSIAVCLTALDARFECQACQDFQVQWNALANSWVKSDKKGEGRLLWATVNFPDGKETFQWLKLETAPVVVFLPVGSGEPVRYDFTTGLPDAELVHMWVSRQLPDSAPKPAFSRPVNYVRLVGGTIAALTIVITTLVAWPYIMPVVQSRNLWAAGCIISILLFISGHMYNQIRGVQYTSTDRQGKTVYFASGFQSQMGLETQIVAAIYAILSFCTIALALKVPRMQDPKAQQAAVLIWGAVMYGVYSFLLSVFRTKNQGYPFGLPPF